MKSRIVRTLCLPLLLAACEDAGITRPQGVINLEVDRPNLMASPEVPRYTGTNEFVLEAQAVHHTGLDLHRNVVIRTCGPTNGVCHNQKEYPDLHTPSNLLAAINSPCNVQPGDWASVFDGCELPGDQFSLPNSDRKVELGYVDYVPGDDEEYNEKNQPTADSPGLHIYLADSAIAMTDRNETWGRARFIRKSADNGVVAEVAYADYETHWWILDGGTHVFGQVAEYQADRVNDLLAKDLGQGDMNRNGTYGARSSQPLSLLHAGHPEKSYLIGRLRGELDGVAIPGTRMPLANEPLSVADMLALYCFVEGLPTEINGVYDMMTPINYANCAAAVNPEELNLLGKGATWIGRVQPLLEANCGGCHGGTAPQGNFDVLKDGLYERLIGPSTQVPGMPFITPGDPANSYLWLKLTSADGIVGLGMPVAVPPEEGERLLTAGPLTDIQTWIMNGAKANE